MAFALAIIAIGYSQYPRMVPPNIHNSLSIQGYVVYVVSLILNPHYWMITDDYCDVRLLKLIDMLMQEHVTVKISKQAESPACGHKPGKPSQISWAYYRNAVRTNEIVILLTITYNTLYSKGVMREGTRLLFLSLTFD